MGRRKITEEAEQAKQTKQEPAKSSSGSDVERQQTTWRARKDLLEELDEWADRYDMSRNAAITMLVRQGLDDK